jgi:phosphatidylglycerophosphate synthase
MDLEPTARRPLKTRSTRWAQRLARWLAARAVSPNGISILSLGFAAMGAVALLAAPAVSPGARTVLLLLAAACVQLRLLCNLLDGMVAVEGGLGSYSGPVYNELPDRIADPLFLVSAGYATGLALGPELGWLAGMLALLTAYVRTLGASLAVPQDFRGPMAKPHRMAALTVGLVAAALGVPFGWDGPLLALALALIVLGTCWTVVRRATTLVRALGSQ